MERIASILLGTLVLFGSAALSIWAVWRTVKKAEDPGRVLFKWIISGIIFIILMFVGAGTKMGDMGSAFTVPIVAAVFGIVLGILWAPHLGAMLARPLTAFYDGGETEVEARPFYSIARANQKRGRYQEAIAEVRKQLAKFSEDYEGWMLLAEIYGDNLKDNLSAQDCINEILGHEGHAPKNIAFALNRAADWHLNLAADRDEARASLQRVVDRYPDTSFGHAAAQRLAHLATGQMLADQKERPRIALTRQDERIGLRGEVADPRPPVETADAAAGRLVQHLDDYPLDADAREELAGIYANHYRRIDLAADQLEQLIASPGVSAKQIARWLNMLADFHIALGPDRPAAEAALTRLVEEYPNTAAAANAEKRIAYMENEMRKNKTSQAMKLGSYDQNIGLMGQVPRDPSGD
jgi:tetratricopeptide (TPR) repeat protein